MTDLLTTAGGVLGLALLVLMAAVPLLLALPAPAGPATRRPGRPDRP